MPTFLVGKGPRDVQCRSNTLKGSGGFVRGRNGRPKGGVYRGEKGAKACCTS